MKKTEWLLAGLLIIMGLVCLTASASTMGGAVSTGGFLKNFLQLCLWMGLPVLVIGVIYLVVLKKKKTNKK